MPGKRDNLFGEERDSDNIVCPRCRQPGLYAVDGEAECVWCKQQFTYEGESERDRLIKKNRGCRCAILGRAKQVY